MREQALFDDRLFLTGVYPCKVRKNDDGFIATEVLYDQEPESTLWVVVFFQNMPRFPISTLRHFSTKSEALRFCEIVEPSTPLESLGGKAPRVPLSYGDYVKWKTSNGLLDFHPDRAYTPGGGNRREMVLQTEEQFAHGLRIAKSTLRECR